MTVTLEYVFFLDIHETKTERNFSLEFCLSINLIHKEIPNNCSQNE